MTLNLSSSSHPRKRRPNPPILSVFTRRPAGPLNYLTKFEEMYAVGLAPAFQPGEVWRMIVCHQPNCPLLADIPSCLCDPDIRFERFAAGGSGPAALATEHVEQVAPR